MSSADCTSFRPHHLRPDKCRNCFGDKSRHLQQQQQSKSNQETEEQQQATSENKAEDEANLRDKSQQSDRGELLANLRKCQEERTKLEESNCRLLQEKNQLIENHKNEIEQFKRQLRSSPGEGKCNTNNKLEQEVEKLRDELQLAKGRIETVEGERDQARNDLRSLEREMEEMHDNFKEEESEQFEQLKQDLDLATKNCKILQIRLNKSERQYGQLEQVKSMLEHQLEEWTNRHRSTGLVQQNQTDSLGSNNGSGFAQLGDDFVKISSREYDQLLRDLNDTLEREKDLQEQIKYSQEEAQMKSDRLQAVEAENEVLLSKVNKLTLANSRLRSNPMRCASMESAQQSVDSTTSNGQTDSRANLTQQQQPQAAFSKNLAGSEAFDLIQQTEQLKLALDLAQSENDRLRHKCQETMALYEARESSLKEYESRVAQLEQVLAATGNAGSMSGETTGQAHGSNEMLAKLELECRHLRTRLVHSERECKQLKAELSHDQARPISSSNHHPRLLGHSLSMESGTGAVSTGEQAKLREIVRQLRDECSALIAQNKELEAKLEHLSTNQNVGGTKMESDLLDKLKNQLETSEQELAKTKSRLVELDLEHARLQRQYKRLVETTDSNQASGRRQVARKVRLPPEQQRDSMGRQELRQILKELEAEADELASRLAGSESLLDELHGQQQDQSLPSSSSAAASSGASEAHEQVKTLRRLLDQERLLSSNLKLDVANLEKTKSEVETSVQMLERERVAMEEELDKLRQVNSELDLSLEEAKRNYRSVSGRLKDVQASNEKLRDEMSQMKSGSGSAGGKFGPGGSELDSTGEIGANKGNSSPQQTSGDMLLLMRDLSELKVKNGFLMRQLEIAREDSGRQLDDLRQAHEVQQRRAIEMAQLELKEKHLAESQLLRDELNDLKQRLASSQRQAARNEEEASGERDRLRSMERDWRRDKSQWQQRLEQLEAQLSIERRSNEYKSKEWESMVRDKERELISIQDKYVQLERDMKRLQNKYSLLEESSESKQKNLSRDLEVKKRELSQSMESNQKREDEYYENCKRFNLERSTLMETLESIKRSYDEKLAELKNSRELLALRQEQSYKERVAAQEQIEQLGDQLIRMSEYEGQAKLLRQQLQTTERHLETVRREHGQLKEERSRLKGKCEELERRCHRYEKQELITKTSHISSSSTNFLRNPFNSSKHSQLTSGGRKTMGGGSGQSGADSGVAADDESEDSPAAAAAAANSPAKSTNEPDDPSQCLMMEKLTSKINDQRHLINMLKQQNEALQLEVKQLRLLQSSDKIRWQGRVNQLQGRLNSCEERLLFESQLLNRDTFEGARRKLEVQWAEERQMSLDTIQQQQAQNDLLTRDLKKLGQAHELLRLHSKQLESHNNKLSRRLIEYQQQQLHLAATTSNTSNHELEVCLTRQEQLTKQNSRLIKLMRDETKPLIETVSKMVTSLDISEAGKQPSAENPPSPEVRPVDPASGDSARLNSTHRPLVTSGTVERKLVTDSPDLISTAKPAHKVATSQSPSRFARLLGKQSKGNSEPSPEVSQDPADKATSISGNKASGTLAAASTTTPTTPTRTVKRVRVKSSALGITLAERKQLKRHLEQLSLALDNLNSEQELAAAAGQQPPTLSKPIQRDQRASSSPANRFGEPMGQPPMTGSRHVERPHSFSQRDSDSAGSTTPSRVHWQLQAGDSSDLDSNKSWSAAGGKAQSSSAASANIYKRFPQTTPASYGASLTDYESESSLASYDEFSTGQSLGGRRFTSGAESDSCVGQLAGGKPLKAGASKKRTLKTRLTSTLRNISRSITGLASDSETESVDGTRSYKKALGSERRLIKGRLGQQQSMAAGDNISNDADNEGTVREIRV